MVRTVRPVNWSLALGAADLLGTLATLDNIEETLRPLPRDETIRWCVRMLNAMALDRRLRERQDSLVDWLPSEARRRYLKAGRDRGVDIRPFHPFQQLVLIHAAARFCTGTGADLTTEAKMQRW